MRECSFPFAGHFWGRPARASAVGGALEIPPLIGSVLAHIAVRVKWANSRKRSRLMCQQLTLPI